MTVISKPCLLVLLLTAIAGVHAAGSVVVANAWVAEPPPVSRVNAGYFRLKNNSDGDVTLTAASSSAYRKVEIHRSIERDGVASMQPVSRVKIAAGESLSFEPGSYHLMLMGPIRIYREGDVIPVELTFADGVTTSFQARVKKQTAAGEHEHHHH